jgi:peptidyl-prolyl cis-trans isomerase D
MPRNCVNPMPKNQNIINKRHIARAEIVRRQSLAIQSVAVAIIVIVVGLLVYGYLSTSVFLPQRAVASVNGERITLREFQGRVRLQRNQLIDNFGQYYQFAQMFGADDPFNDPNFGGILQQIFMQMQQPQQIGQEVLDVLIDERLIRQEAKKMGIEPDAAEIDRYVQEQFGYFADGTPTPAPTQPPFVAPTLNPTQLAVITVTPLPEPTLVVTEEPVDEPTVMPDEEGAEPTPLPSATPFTIDAFQANYDESISGLTEITGLTTEDFRYFFESLYLRDKLLEVIAADVQSVEEQIWVQHILVDSEELANEILARFAQGESWSDLAATYSIDASNAQNDGDLGWIGPDVAFVPEFKQAAFALGQAEISAPVQSQFGWHIIRVLGRELRPVEEQRFQQMRQEAFTLWLAGIRAESNVETYDLWMEHVPTDPELPF